MVFVYTHPQPFSTLHGYRFNYATCTFMITNLKVKTIKQALRSMTYLSYLKINSFTMSKVKQSIKLN